MPIGIDGKMIEQEIIDKFVMPKPMPGQVVKYWSDGVRGRNPVVAWVTSVAPRTISLRSANGSGSSECRYVDDPKLQLNADQREGGCWDFTDEHVDNKSWKDEVIRRIVKLEDSIARLTVATAKQDVPAKKVSIPVAVAAKAVDVGIESVDDNDDDSGFRKPRGFELFAQLRKEAAALGIQFSPTTRMQDLKVMVDEAKGLTKGSE